MGGAARATSGGSACWVAGTAWCGTGISGDAAHRQAHTRAAALERLLAIRYTRDVHMRSHQKLHTALPSSSATVAPKK